jgi:hypothetical protein
MKKKYILSLVLLISAGSVFAMNTHRKVNHRQPRREEPALKEKKDMREREARRAAFLVALANGTLVCADNKLIFPGLLDQPDHAIRLHLPISSLDSFIPAALKTLKDVETIRDVQKNFPRTTEAQAYCILAAQKIFVKKSDLEAIDDPRFEANKLPDFKNRAAVEVIGLITRNRKGLLKAMKCEKGENKQSNIQILLEQPLHPWNQPLHCLVLDKIESGEIKQAE